MAEHIPQDFIDNVLRHTDIVEIVSEYVTLKQRGRNFQGLCPFHAEKTPSFSVNPEKQIFYCFGCHVGGSALTFLMKKENYPFLEALELLADRAGLSLPQRESSVKDREKEVLRQRWRDIYAHAAAYFQGTLQRPEGREALAYLRSRGIDDDTLNRFGLGYAPQGWTGLLAEMRKHGFGAQELETTGLVVAKNREPADGASSHYDRFRHRVIFAIRDVQGRVIAFGGRVLDDAVPKYLNSPETMFFSKGRGLYALDLAVPAIRAKGYVLLMEGYMDVIAAHRMGCKTAVATLGTALTRDQAYLLKRYAAKVYICYDSDVAGVQAACRAGEMLAAEDVDAFVVDVSPAKDPDEFLASASLDEFEERRRQAKPYLEFKFRTVLAERDPENQRLELAPEDKARLIQKLAPEVMRIKSPIVRESMERLMAKELGVTYEAVSHELFQIESKRKRTKKNAFAQQDFLPKQDISVRNRNTIEETRPVMSAVPPGIFAAEQLILRILLEDPRLAEGVVNRLGEGFWSIGEHKKIFESISKISSFGSAGTAQQDGGAVQAVLAAESEHTDICGRLAAILEIEYAEGREDEILNDCLDSLLNAQNRVEIERMQQELACLGSTEELTAEAKDMARAMLENLRCKQIEERLRRG
ncbi:MAG: DNA primase [Peptococcaceae bacterium]|nr:DNA primase [Peptococcaceae bacterium]